MTIDGDVIMWVFGLVFVAFSGLASLLWALLDKRIAKTEDDVTADRERMDKVVDKLFDELKEDRRNATASNTKILEGIAQVNRNVDKLALAMSDRKAECQLQFASKEDLAHLQKQVG